MYFKTGNRWDADDLVSEIFRKAFENFAAVSRNEKAWLFSIARNTVIDFYRKRKDIASSDKLDLYINPDSFETRLEKAEEMKILRDSLVLLTEEEQEIISLRYFSGMKHKEIAGLMGKSEQSIKMKVMRVTRRLKDLITKEMEGSL